MTPVTEGMWDLILNITEVMDKNIIGEVHVNVWQKPPQYCNVISLQLNKKKKSPSTPKKERLPRIW